MATHTTTNETVTAALNLIAAEIMNRSDKNLDLVLVDATDESLCDYTIEWIDGRTEPVFSITRQLSEGTW